MRIIDLGLSVCGRLARISARPSHLLISDVCRKRDLFYRSLAGWQSRDHTEKHVAALRTKTEIMEEDRPSSTCSDEKNDPPKKKPPFGTRFLTDPQNVFQHNAWDNVVWDEEQEAEARKKTLEQLQDALSPEEQEEYEQEANMYWDKFYSQHQNRFFKDRHWLFTEFPELYSPGLNTSQQSSGMSSGSSFTTTSSQASEMAQHKSSENEDSCQESSQSVLTDSLREKESRSSAPVEDGHQSVEKTDNDAVAASSSSSAAAEAYPGESATFRILEVGCGVGNTVFPVLSTNNDPGLMMYCCDFSTTAVQLVKDHPDYDPKRCHAFVWDITDEDAELPFPPESLDVVIMIFVLSAVHPDKMQRAVNRLAACLKPGGQILLRDYGRFDMAQLRFKKGRCLSENFYVRGDGTRVYFFTQEEFRAMFQQAGLEEVQNLIDRRLQVNRGRQLTMYRVWIQCKFRKPDRGAVSADGPSS